MKMCTLKVATVASGLGLCMTASMWAQKGGGGGTTEGPPASKNAEMSSGVGKYANFDQLQAHQTGSLEFVGKVAVAGGMLPWDPVPVVISCNGKTAYNTQTDPQGEFRIRATPRQSEVIADASNPKLVGPGQLIGCQVHGVLQGFKSSIVTIANASLLDNPDLGTITLTRDEKAEGAALSATTAAAPKDALKDFDKARSDALNRHPDSAQHNLEKAVHADPQFAEAWYQLGKMQENQKPQEAWDDFNKAVAADPQFAPPYEHMAAVAAQQKNWKDVVDATDHALKLNPEGTPQLWYYSAVGNYNTGNKTVAEESARKSIAMDPSHLAPNTEQLLAVMLAGRGDYAGALDHLRHCLTYAQPGPNADLIKQQIAQLEKLAPPSAH